LIGLFSFYSGTLWVPLPWVKAGKHLGNNITNSCDGMKQDIKIKRAAFIDKNNELNQEFAFAHPLTKVKMNNIFNFHFTGSPLWDLFSREAIMLENTWNTAVRIMFDIPLSTHRYFIEPLSQTDHLKKVLLRRFLSFLNQIEKSTKQVPKHLLRFIKYDTKSTTGSNLRNLLLLTNKNTIDELGMDDIDKLKYCDIEEDKKWRVQMAKEIIDIKSSKLELDNFSTDELDEMLEHLCTT
jgi:hypothetical protein